MAKEIHNSSVKGVDIKGENISIDSNNHTMYNNAKKESINAISITVLVVNLLMLGVNICILCRSCPRTEMSFDYIGFLIGVLSLITAITLTWQVFASIINKNKVDNLSISTKDVYNKISRLNKMNKHLDIQIKESKSDILKIVNEKIQRERKLNFLNYEYLSAIKFLYEKNYDVAFRKLCYVACEANDMKEVAFLDNSLDMAENIISQNSDEFVARKSTGFYRSTKERLKNIEDNRVTDIIDFIEEKYGVFSKQNE